MQPINKTKNKITSPIFLKKEGVNLFSIGIPVIILSSYVFLAFRPDMRPDIYALLLSSAVTVAALAFSLYAGERGYIRWSPATIIAIAFVIRIIFVIRPPELSDDIYRYLWDGLQMLNGNNPYASSPLEAQLGVQLPEHLRSLINHPDLHTIYPPAAQLFFAAGAALGKSVSGMKIMFLAIDIATCIILIKILYFLSMPVWRSVLYAWHPLPVLEIGGSGHVDGTGIFFFLLSMLLLFNARTKRSGEKSPKTWMTFISGLSFAVASLVKLFPMVFMPGLLIIFKKRNRSLFIAGMLTGFIFLTVSFLPDITRILFIIGVYFKNWEFSSLTFRFLREITSSGNLARIILYAGFMLCMAVAYVLLWQQSKVQTLVSSQKDRLLSLPHHLHMEFGLIMIFHFVALTYLFLTPTFYPWYMLYAVCFFPFTTGVFSLILSWTVFLSYRVLIEYSMLGLWKEDTMVPLVIWGAPALAFLIVAAHNKMRKKKHN